MMERLFSFQERFMKPLSLLKALIASGGEAPEERIVDILA
jgi:hypothetical protein